MFWTEELYEKAYDIVKDRKWPIIIPSYNRPNPIIMQKLFTDFTNEYNWPIYIVVAKSQEKEYNELNENKYATIYAIEDSLVDDVGKKKSKCLEFAKEKGFKSIFMLDDDVPEIGFNMLTKSGKGNPRAGLPNYELNTAKIFALWQLASEVCFDKYGVVMTHLANKSNSWPIENVNEENSMKLITGKGMALCFNIEELFKRPYKYESEKTTGFSDMDFLIKIFAYGDKNCILPWLHYTMPNDFMSMQNYEFYKDLDERYNRSSRILFENHRDKDFIKEVVKTNKEGISRKGIKLDTIKIRKEQNIEEFKYNLYKDIKEIYNI